MINHRSQGGAFGVTSKLLLACLLLSPGSSRAVAPWLARSPKTRLFEIDEDTAVRVRAAGRGGFGDVLEVYTRGCHRGSSWTRRFKFYQEGSGIESVVPWTAPAPGLDPRGFAFRLTFSTGSGWGYIVVAEVAGRWKVVLHLDSDGGGARNSELVDVDGDGYPESEEANVAAVTRQLRRPAMIPVSLRRRAA